MEIKDILEQVKKSHDFQSWRAEHKEEYLAHIFIMFDGDNLMDKQVGYYSQSSNTMTSFTVSDDSVTMIPEAEVFKKPDGNSVGKLDLDSVKIGFDEAVEKADGVLKDKYQTNASKKIYILQNIEEKDMWNVTLLTQDYSTINIRIDASTGELIKDEKVNLIDFEKSG